MMPQFFVFLVQQAFIGTTLSNNILGTVTGPWNDGSRQISLRPEWSNRCDVILSASPLEQNRILGDTDLGEVAEAGPPTSDGSESNLSSASPVSC